MEHLWIINSYNTLEFTKEFYDLPLVLKYKYLSTLPDRVLENFISHERVVQAIIQHSPNKSRKEFPIKRERKLSSKARQADLEMRLINDSKS